MRSDARIYVAGHTGLVGSAVVRKLLREGFTNLILRSRAQLDLTNRGAVESLFRDEQPEYVVDCAARVGGIEANMSRPAEFFYENLEIQNNLIQVSSEARVRKFLFLGSSCIYPRDCPQPMQEKFLFGFGNPEPTNEAYAYAKLVGIKFCIYVRQQLGLNFVSCVPTNIFGEGDNFDPQSSHVIPALMRKLHEGKLQGSGSVSVWGDGSSRREFMHVDDVADAILWLLRNYDRGDPINIGTGKDISIKDLAFALQALVGFEGEIDFDTAKPGGMPRKLLNVEKINKLGWHHKIPFEIGLRRTYEWFIREEA